MHSKKTVRLLFALLCVLFVSTIYFAVIKRNNIEVSNLGESLSGGDSEFSIANSLYSIYIPFIVKTEGELIDSTIVIEDSSLKKIKLISLMKGKRKLVFRYSFRDCDLCVNTVKGLIYKNIIDKENVLFLSDNYSTKDFILKEKSSDKRVSCYNIVDGISGLNLEAIEGKNLPFLFVLNSDLRVQKVFIPFKEDPQQIEEYLNYINEIL
ncbi:hypothetical protein COR50_05645 [Chitinophaga caeni]|uniref:Alkyl hydroperoxide reductase subunit C/ Thiol specific antioxidant domain-containing protein n=1 Tax=Chitinophaga caeni TaxID=2029983 RepID=A0A291QS91_9BACT|nr:hypothetical protein [Chitinophaga caeni]ATL46704.1 hypothetical protein COR50_05645 [Chitinophaga caeni]